MTPLSRRRGAGLLALALLGAAVLACAGRVPDRRRVAASIFPLYDIVRRVAGDRLVVELVLPPGQTSHSFHPKPRDVAALSDVTLVFTHGDWDHVLGRPWWPRAATLAHDRFAAEIRERYLAILDEARGAASRAGETWTRGFEPFSPDHAVSGLRFLRFGPWRLVFRDAPGHSASMLSIHLPDRALLLAADMLSDLEIPMIDLSWSAYRSTLVELLPLAQHGAIETLVPGHGAIAHGRDEVVARIERDLGYLDSLALGVAKAQAEGLTLEAAQGRLEAMEYTGKRAEYSMVEEHRRNVVKVFREGAHAEEHG